MGSVRRTVPDDSTLGTYLDWSEELFELAQRKAAIAIKLDQDERAVSPEYAFVEFQLQYARREAMTSLEAAFAAESPQTVYEAVIDAFTH